MNKVIQKLLKWMLRKHIIGHKHFPEDLLIKSKISHLSRKLQNEFYEEYRYLIKKSIFWRLKKKTGKGSEWHISLNPEKIDEINEYIGDTDEGSDWEIL